ncbi:alpha/beta fold hydrolase [Allokutzneria sp. NRRL B-24872]|uniref:alpha/beta fold hydrolase n=1 Tax=Allokutzneria sp. NRRL B-24872 TaxID=1137961 RepID=UPI000A3C6010|nr:alpha/beta fold hydrolase [Allokutzneria sp. NRRL B-24872]
MATYLLVHGAWHSARCWDRVIPLLEAAGHRVLAPTLTGYGDKIHLAGPEVGLDTHVADVLGLITEQDLAEVVLVGHSYAGLVISSVANAVPERIAHLVHLDAMVPEHGEAAVDVMPVSRQLVELALNSDSGWRIPPPGTFGVTDPDDVAWLRTMLSDQPVRCLLEPVRLDNPAVKAVPRTHIHSTVVPEGFERRAAPPGERVLELPTGHDCMITMPRELTDLLVKIG